MASTESPKLTLYGYYKSSCAARVRVALAYKQISFNPIYVKYGEQQHRSDEYAKMNPSKSVPTLVIDKPGEALQHITQSVAAVEYLEEAYPDSPSLLPAPTRPFDRAIVRSLVQIIVADVQPVTNSRVFEKVVPLGVDGVEWGEFWHVRGLGAYEKSIQELSGKYSVGDKVTMADVCLAPAVWNAIYRYKMSLNGFATVKKVYDNLMMLPAFRDGFWTAQPDCPADDTERLNDA